MGRTREHERPSEARREEPPSKVVLVTERGTAAEEEGVRRGGRSRRWRGGAAAGGRAHGKLERPPDSVALIAVVAGSVGFLPTLA